MFGFDSPLGYGATAHLESGGFIRSRPNVTHPDIQFHFLPSQVIDHGRIASKIEAYQVCLNYTPFVFLLFMQETSLYFSDGSVKMFVFKTLATLHCYLLCAHRVIKKTWLHRNTSIAWEDLHNFPWKSVTSYK